MHVRRRRWQASVFLGAVGGVLGFGWAVGTVVWTLASSSGAQNRTETHAFAPGGMGEGEILADCHQEEATEPTNVRVWGTRQFGVKLAKVRSETGRGEQM